MFRRCAMFSRCLWLSVLGCQSGSVEEGARILSGTGGTTEVEPDAGTSDAATPPVPPEGLLCDMPIEILNCYVEGGNEVDTYTPGALPPLHMIGIYTADLMDIGNIDAHVHVAAGSMILALSGQERTHWTITSEPSATLERVILVGYGLQTADAPAGVEVESHSYDGGEHELPAYGGYSWPPEDPDCETSIRGNSCTNHLIAYVEGLAGRKVTAFAGCYVANEFTVNACDCPEPSCTAPEPLSVECGGPAGAARSDADVAAWLGQATATGGCGEVAMANDAPELFAASCTDDPIPTVVTFTATDADGNTATCTSSVTVLDTTAPSVTLEQTAACLWPPSHEMAGVASILVSDVCDPNAGATGVAVSSDERTSSERGAGGPKKCPDAWVADGVIRLRAERAGPSGADNGRVYGAVRAFASDRCGNAAEAALPVGTAPGCPGAVCVPHDHGSAGSCPAVDDGQVDATVCN